MSKHNRKRILPYETHEQMIGEWMSDPLFKSEYDALEEEYELLREVLKVRNNVVFTQDSNM